MVFWEMTQACDLACKHCRACAVPRTDPLELTTEQGRALLREVQAMGCPNLVLSGGDPAKRLDLVPLVEYGTSLRLRVALTPSATPLVDGSSAKPTTASAVCTARSSAACRSCVTPGSWG